MQIETVKVDKVVIIISAKSEELDILLGLELGADDYVVKPFSPKVLFSRIKAVLRRGKELSVYLVCRGEHCALFCWFRRHCGTAGGLWCCRVRFYRPGHGEHLVVRRDFSSCQIPRGSPIGEVFRARSEPDLVGRPTQVADDELMLREARVQQRFEVAEVRHPLGQRVADEHDLIVRLQF